MKKFKFLIPVSLALALVLVCIFAIPTKAQATTEEYISGDFKYTVSNGEATITKFWPQKMTTFEAIVPSTIDGYPVTKIARYAFSNVDLVTHIYIPDSVILIEDGVFHYPNNNCLYGIWVDEDNPNYSSDTQGTLYNKNKTLIIRAPVSTVSGDYVIPEGVTAIGDCAFYDCRKLESVIIPNTVTSIGGGAFGECDSLTTITIPDSVTTVESGFSNCKKIIVAEGSKTVTFTMIPCKDTLEEVVIPDSVTTIGWQAFSRCNKLTTVTIPDSVTTIEAGAFEFCSRLTSLTIPDGVTTIGYFAFRSCTGLTTLVVPDSVNTVGKGAFSSCNNLNFNIYNEAKYLGNEENLYVILIEADEGNALSFKPHDQTKIIGSHAFAAHNNLTSVIIPDSITTIEELAFAYCSSMSTITIGKAVVRIGDHAFEQCDNLKDVYYVGTKAQWDAIEIEDGNSWLKNATIHYGGVGHSFTNYVSDNNATCLEDGTKTAVCDDAGCSETRTVVDVGSALGHSFTNYISNNDATYDADGTKTAKCDRCDETETVTDEGSKLIRNGWFYIDGKWYYYKQDIKQTGWLKVGAYWYYLDRDGVMQTGWLQLGKAWYYLKPSGEMVTGWCKVGTIWYYFNTSGAMVTGEYTIGGKLHKFNSSGVWLGEVQKNGWVMESGKWYFYQNGTKKTGWLYQGGVWYYMDASGAMSTGWKQIGGTWYYFNASGAMATGWVQVGGTWYYMNSSGAMVTGWLCQGGKWYYLNSSGAMQTGWKQIGGTWYYFESSGVMATGWKNMNQNGNGAWAQAYLQHIEEKYGEMYFYTLCYIDDDEIPELWIEDELSGVGRLISYKNGELLDTMDLRIGGDMMSYIPYSGLLYVSSFAGNEVVSDVAYKLENGSAVRMGYGTIVTDGQKIVELTWNGEAVSESEYSAILDQYGTNYIGYETKYSYQEIQEQMDSTWYYFNASGAMQTGWLKQGNVWYYFHASGEMATGSVLIGNKTYNFDSSGACLNP